MKRLVLSTATAVIVTGVVAAGSLMIHTPVASAVNAMTFTCNLHNAHQAGNLVNCNPPPAPPGGLLQPIDGGVYRELVVLYRARNDADLNNLPPGNVDILVNRNGQPLAPQLQINGIDEAAVHTFDPPFVPNNPFIPDVIVVPRGNVNVQGVVEAKVTVMFLS